jgi:predicted ArsR family transcriptional regulator
VTSEARKVSTVGRPQVVFTAVDREPREGRDHRLLADILAGVMTTTRQQERATELARDWGAYLVGRSVPKPGARRPSGPNLAILQAALAEAGFDPRFHRRSAKTVEITMRGCPFRDLLEEHRSIVCAVHRGLLEGMLGASRPAMVLKEFEPPAERTAVCRLVARGA